ncbi:Translation initiation factor IF- 2, domain 3 [Kalmanozyma brasiliensis GHG001]|uniref:Translation initiation factor IF- 2, domain 3 n=1 Tax=Kalmanozyma brasiliensis (strain GHG001) TaxID=1365824 RepID=UPI002868184B|nr:Translation initiation factor IF- 2, domain 3 [Kalmanozyma brasiliensis GHG001]KAF6767459.1 Translation initiation factor IF- 2, domain 3 [Kalmanozyma brasiliensis GHG001]
MLSRTSLSLASSSRLASWATASTSRAAAALSTAPSLSRSLSSTPLAASGREGSRPSHSQNRDRDGSDYRPRRRDDASQPNQRSGGSNYGNPVAQFSRNQRFSPDGTRKRLPHPNAKSRPPQDRQGGNRERGGRPRDGGGYTRGGEDASAMKFGSAEPDALGSGGAAKRDSTLNRIKARSLGGDEEAGGSGRFEPVESDDSPAPSRYTSDDAPGRRNDKSDRHHTAKHKKKEGRGSLLDHPPSSSSRNRRRDDDPLPRPRTPPKLKPKLLKIERNIFLPPLISVIQLCMRMEKKLIPVQQVMTSLGMEDTRPDLMLKFSDAEMIAAQLNVVAIPNEEASFDLFPRPAPTPDEAAGYPVRPPVVSIMGHVDHGKTTLLDRLRSTSVAAGEAGGITQHIGAFSVPISYREQDKGKKKGYAGIQTITFLDTPGHAAFTAMRSRGAMVTDIVVLVVAADDGVMPQTREVISLVQAANKDAQGEDEKPVQMVVALTKVDKPEADPDRVKRELLSAGVELEELGGDIPCVHVSGKTGKGIDELEETLAALAELADIRADRTGLPEGYVIESKVDKGRGNVATVLIKRGTLEKAAPIVAGTAWCKVRQIIHSSGKPLARGLPGDPVLVSGWRTLPTAGDLLLGGTDEQSCKRASENRRKLQDERRLMDDVEQINEARRVKAEADEAEARREFEERQRRRAARIAADDGKDPAAVLAALDGAAPLEGQDDVADVSEEKGADEPGARKMLNVIVKADFSGTVEAVVGAISSIGNAEAGVKIISAIPGEPSESDVSKAAALGATIIGFNVTPPKAILQSAARAQPTPVPIIASDVIYRLMETVSQKVAELLPPTKEARVHGEATVSQIFEINLKGRNFKKIAGCRVTNGTIAKSNLVRVLRGDKRDEVYRGKLDEFKHVKKDVTEMRKGTECGMSFEGWQELKEGDVVQSFSEVEVARTL